MRAASSKTRRGLVADSVKTLSGRLRYSVAVWVFMAALLERLNVRGRRSGQHQAVCRLRWLVGFRQFRRIFLCSGGGFRCAVFKCGEDDGRSFLDHLKALGEECRVAVV